MPIDGYGVSGHGVVVETEGAPIVQGTFSALISGVTSDLSFPGTTRTFTKTTPHDKGVDGGITENVMQREPLDLEINYIAGSNHDTVLFDHYVNNRSFGVRLTGVNNGIQVIQSGELASWNLTHPNEGPQKLMCTMNFSGPFIVDGEVYD